MSTRVLVFVLAAGAASACKPLGHRGPPDVTVAAPERFSAAAGAEPLPVPADAWWRSFDEPALDGVVAAALAANPDLRASAARVRQAAAQARIAGADRLPALDLGADASRREQIFVGLPVPGGDVLESTSTTYGVSLDVSWELDLWGRLLAQEDAAARDLAASASDHEAARQSLAAQTAKGYFAWAQAERLLELAERTRESFARTLTVTQSRFEGGLGVAVDVRLAAANLAAAEALSEGRHEARERARRQLEILLGRYPDGMLPLEPRLAPLPPLGATGAPGELLGRRPDLRAAEERLRAADERLYAARAALYPRLSFAGSVGRTSDDPGDLVDPDFSIWSLAGNLAQPVFQGGRLRAGVDLADARVAESLAAFEAAQLRAFEEVESALAADGFLARQEERQGRATDEARAAAELAEERYAAGLTEFLTVLEAQRRAFETETQLLEVRRRRLENRIDLHLALGGGLGDPEPTP